MNISKSVTAVGSVGGSAWTIFWTLLLMRISILVKHVLKRTPYKQPNVSICIEVIKRQDKLTAPSARSDSRVGPSSP